MDRRFNCHLDTISITLGLSAKNVVLIRLTTTVQINRLGVLGDSGEIRV